MPIDSPVPILWQQNQLSRRNSALSLKEKKNFVFVLLRKEKSAKEPALNTPDLLLVRLSCTSGFLSWATKESDDASTGWKGSANSGS